MLGVHADTDGWIGAPLAKVLALMTLATRIVRAGRVTRILLGALLGSWIFVIMFRRPALRVLFEAFRFLELFRGDRRVCLLPGAICLEFWALVLWAPLL